MRKKMAATYAMAKAQELVILEMEVRHSMCKSSFKVPDPSYHQGRPGTKAALLNQD